MRNGRALFTILGKLSECARASSRRFLKWHPATSDATTHRSSRALPATAGRQHEIF